MSVPEQLADESPTTKLVYLVLAEQEDAVSQHVLADRTDLHVRQVREALTILDQYDLLEERQNLQDLREKHYEVA